MVLCVQVRHTDTETQKPFLKAATLEKLWNIHSRMFMAALRKMKKKKNLEMAPVSTGREEITGDIVT